MSAETRGLTELGVVERAAELMFSDADTPSELFGLFAGAASMCWSDVAAAGVFNSERASQLVDAAIARLIELGWLAGETQP